MNLQRTLHAVTRIILGVLRDLAVEFLVSFVLVAGVLLIIWFSGWALPFAQPAVFVVSTLAMCTISFVFVKQTVRGWLEGKDGRSRKANVLYVICGSMLVFFFVGLAVLFLAQFFGYLQDTLF